MDTNRININKQGNIILPINKYNYLINNFSESGTTSSWTFGGTTPTLSNGIEILTGTGPGISSSTFTIGPNDIIIFEFTVSIPTPSTTTSGPGLYLGTKYGQTVKVHPYNFTNKNFTINTSTNTNPYFISAYNLASTLTIKNYIAGYNVDMSNFYYLGESTNTAYAPKVIQLTGTDTSTYIRSGYNSNTSMVIYFSNPKIYRADEVGMVEKTGNAKLGSNFIQSESFYEI